LLRRWGRGGGIGSESPALVASDELVDVSGKLGIGHGELVGPLLKYGLDRPASVELGFDLVELGEEGYTPHALHAFSIGRLIHQTASPKGAGAILQLRGDDTRPCAII